MRRSTAARYLDLSEAEFGREVASGRIPVPFRLGRSDHWSKQAIDIALGLHLDPPEDDWRSRQPAYQRDVVDQPLAADASTSPAIFTPETLAAHWGMPVERIYSLFHSGQVRGFRLGKKLIRFRAEEVVAAEERVRITR